MNSFPRNCPITIAPTLAHVRAISGVADVAPVAGGWQVGNHLSGVSDVDALNRLLPLFAGARPVLVYLHGNANPPASCFARCTELEALYDKAVEMRPSKGDAVNIPYGQIDKASYEYTTGLTIALTEAKHYWLQIDYHDQDARKVLVLMMDKHDYLRILEALKTHTGIDAEILGANKR